MLIRHHRRQRLSLFFPTTRICLSRSSTLMSLVKPRRLSNLPARSSSRITGMSRGTTRQGVTPCKQIGNYQNHGQGERYSASYASLFQKAGNGCKVGRPENKRQIVRRLYGLSSGKRSLLNRRSKQHENGPWKSQSSKQLKPPEVLNACPQMTMSTQASSTQPEHN